MVVLPVICDFRRRGCNPSAGNRAVNAILQYFERQWFNFGPRPARHSNRIMEDLKQALKSQRRGNRTLITALRLDALGRYAAEYRDRLGYAAAGTANRTARSVAPHLGAGACLQGW